MTDNDNKKSKGEILVENKTKYAAYCIKRFDNCVEYPSALEIGLRCKSWLHAWMREEGIYRTLDKATEAEIVEYAINACIARRDGKKAALFLKTVIKMKD